MDERIIRNVMRLREQGASDAEIEQYLRSEGTSTKKVILALDKRKSVQETGIDTESSFLGALGQGATLGFSDEILAGGRALMGQHYDKALQAEQVALARYRTENPARAIGGELAGGLATAWIPGMGAGNVARTVGQQALRAGAQGAALGGVAGFGSTNGSLEERLGGAAVGAGLGGAIGGAVPAVMASGRVAGQKGIDILGLRTAAGSEQRADELLAQALLRDGRSPEEVAQILERAAAAGKPLGIVDVTGQNTLGLGRAAASVPSSTKQSAYTALMERADDAPSRISQNLQDTMQVPQTSYVDAADAIQQRMRTSAKPLYDAAYEAGKVIDDPRLLSMIAPNSPLREVKPQAWRFAQRQAALEGEQLDNPFRMLQLENGGEMVEIVGPVSLKTMDYVKRGLDSVIGAEKDGNIRRLLRNRKEELVDALDDKYPEYKAARAQYRGDAELRDSLEAGRAFLSETSDVTASQIAKMSDAEKRVFRVGAITAVRDAINTAKDKTDIVRRIFGSPEKRAQLRAVFPSDNAYREFERLMKMEAEAAATKNAILSGSRTTPLAQEINDMGMNPSLMQEFLRGQGASAAPRAAAMEILMNRAQGVRGAVADALNNRLFNFDPASQQQTLRGLSDTAANLQQQQLSRQYLRESMGRSLGTVPGLFAE